MLPEIIQQPSKKDLKKITLFRDQILTNKLSLQPLLFPKFKGVTAWEELECLGYNPELSKIEAVVKIKNPTGYSGGLCSNGSPEFVRFFIDYHDGNGFEDLGLASFRAFDISEQPAGPQHPISYMVSKHIDVYKKRKFCLTETLVTLRAVLSWNTIPSHNPNQVPNYGNILDAEAVLKPRYQFAQPALDISLGGLTIPTIQDLNLPIETIANEAVVEQKKPLDVSSFLKLNMEEGVAPLRAMTQVMNLTSEENSSTIVNELKKMKLADMGIDLGQFVADLGNKNFNVNYEELVSVGLNTAQDTLGAVINIKRPNGYGGGLCNKGSLEYVAFFADFNNNGTYEKHLGTTFVKVNDIKSIPAEGLKYALFMKTDLSKYLRNCKSPRIVRIRAILSWTNPPNPNNPNQAVAWGNRIDTLVQLRPKKSTQTSIIYSVGNVAVDNISTSTCLAYPGNTNRGNNRPWGGRITIKGGIDKSGSPGTTKYRVEYSKDGINYNPVTLKQKIRTIHFATPLTPFKTHNLEDPNGWFPYLANHNASNLIVIENDVLATWPSHDFAGKYYIRVAYTKSNPITNPGSIQYSIPVRIQLDNRRFRVDEFPNPPNNTLDAQFDLDMTIEGGICKVYKQGDIITGHVKARDQFYGGYDLNIQPATQVINHAGLITYAPGAITNNAAINYYGPLNEKFTIDTGKLNPCGYTVRLRGFERTILNNSHTFPRGHKYLGFCVKE